MIVVKIAAMQSERTGQEKTFIERRVKIHNEEKRLKNTSTVEGPLAGKLKVAA